MTPREALAMLELNARTGLHNDGTKAVLLSCVEDLRSAVEDQERLDWLEQGAGTLESVYSNRRQWRYNGSRGLGPYANCPRTALDAARTQDQEKETRDGR